jgi:hypothetical protein
LWRKFILNKTIDQMRNVILKCSIQPRRVEQRLVVVFTVIILFFASIVTSTFAQRGAGSGVRHGTSYVRMYNPNTVETVSGTVISVNRVLPSKRMSVGIHLMLRTKKEIVSVHLGPEWYIQRQKMTIRAKDKITVKGSKVDFGGELSIVAAEVKKGKETLLLRNANGFPLWSGRGRRH